MRFEIIPFKASKTGASAPRVKRYHVHALPNRVEYEIRFPRVEGYTQAIRNKITILVPFLQFFGLRNF